MWFEFRNIFVHADRPAKLLVGFAAQGGVHDDRNAGKTRVALDVFGQHVAIHFRHFHVGQHQLDETGDRDMGCISLSGDFLQFIPRLPAVIGADVTDVHGIQGARDLFAATDESSAKKMVRFSCFNGSDVVEQVFCHRNGWFRQVLFPRPSS